jgi:uncharacterized protein (TIGR03790 family)
LLLNLKHFGYLMRMLLAGLALLLFYASQWAQAIIIELPAPGVRPATLAVIVNDSDPLSREIADYYQQQRAIPADNIIHVAFDPGQAVMKIGEFAVMKSVIDAQAPPSVQAYLLTWAQPYRVACMSMSAAMTFGFDRKYCASGCNATATSVYANSSSLRPFSDLSIRPSMLLAAMDIEQARALIDRGVAASAASPARGAAYLLETSDKARSVRKALFPRVLQAFNDILPVYMVKADSISGQRDVMFYFTGAKYVEAIASNQYLPGAMADHLTSTGGKLVNNERQMSAMRWLEAGVTGSYGTVVEPCNILAKFPNPVIAIGKYLQGESLLEAYWKSVAMPGQGVFIGEPLARPYARYRLRATPQGLLLTAFVGAGNYRLLRAALADGPAHFIADAEVQQQGILSFLLKPPYSRVYRIAQQP